MATGRTNRFVPPRRDEARPVPANRSRTQNWRRNLEQVHERGGTIEVAVYQPGLDQLQDEAGHLMWRVRILSVLGDGLQVEQPLALGKSVDIRPGTTLLGIMTIGQNRWRFETSCVEPFTFHDGGRTIAALRLSEPTQVRRCQRTHARLSTGGVSLPRVEMWPLLDPASVVLAERACQLEARQGSVSLDDEERLPADGMLPDVGPRFEVTLTNIGGGGIGIDAEPDQASSLARHKVFWLRFALPPAVPTPICATAKLAHTRLQSDQHVHAGLAFDFSFNPEHRQFVTEQIERYMVAMQERTREVA